MGVQAPRGCLQRGGGELIFFFSGPKPPRRKNALFYLLHRANGRGRFGGQTAGGHPKAFPWPKKPLFAVPALRELESACRLSIL